MKALKAGDRVRAFGISGQGAWHSQLDGTVRVVQDDPPRIHFDSDIDIGPGRVERFVAMPQQCRRLIRRERRRWEGEWVNAKDVPSYVVAFVPHVYDSAAMIPGRRMTLIEARPRKEGK